jgi:uncharacterized membrane protein YfcA
VCFFVAAVAGVCTRVQLEFFCFVLFCFIVPRKVVLAMVFVLKEWGIYTGIAFPVFGLIGVAAGTIGFTAFLLAVPLLYVGFGFEPEEAIFISASVDCANAVIILALSYIKRDERTNLLPRFAGHLKALLFVGSFAIVCCCVCLVFAARVLEFIRGRLKGKTFSCLLV